MLRSLIIAALLVLLVLGAAIVVYQRVLAPEVDSLAVAVDNHVALPLGPADAGLDSAASVDGGTIAENRAEIVAARGSVQARIGENGPWADASVGQQLATADSVRAGRNAEATLRMGNGVEVRLSPRSEFTIRELNDRVSKIRLDEGHVTASVDSRGTRVLKVAARGTDAEAESTGGEFGVVTDGSGQLAVATTTGTAKLTAGGASVEVPAGQTSSAIVNGVPTAPRPIPTSLFLKIGNLGPTKTNQSHVTVTGQADPGSIVRSGDLVAKVDERGRFKVQVPLQDGENIVAVEVVDAQGRSKSQALPPITVDREKPKIEAETTWGAKAP